MADRVRSRNSPHVPYESQLTATQEHAVPRKPTPPASEKRVPPSPDQAYVIQIPRDQVIRVPPSENARRMEQYDRRKNLRSPCCCFLCWLMSLILIIGIAGGGILYLLHHLKAPRYTVDRISIHGMNLTSTESQAISPEFDIILRAKNPNNIFGIYYEKDSTAKVYYKELRLGSGALPAFYQPSNHGTACKRR
ncbi:NDR1/HIN1-like protein 13 [Neltuma alba]|uniref:NDR1/HIN1-like protein 13 n=1 Tax=Neltuma alba TaxID=207710 RepID=UPI0010A5126F|nr:NDR1/HIN1-like protein 13 [Prosopis alba]